MEPIITLVAAAIQPARLRIVPPIEPNMMSAACVNGETFSEASCQSIVPSTTASAAQYTTMNVTLAQTRALPRSAAFLHSEPVVQIVAAPMNAYVAIGITEVNPLPPIAKNGENILVLMPFARPIIEKPAMIATSITTSTS